MEPITASGPGPSSSTAGADTTTADATDTSEATTDTTTDDGSGSSSGGGSGACGDGNPDPGEACDDGDDDPTDGCLPTCELARSCAHVGSSLVAAPDGAYVLHPAPDETITTWCDMTTEGGGWTLVAKVNPTDAHTDPDTEPAGWFGMTLADELLVDPDLTLNGPLASHGAARFAGVIGAQSVARFELVAADDFAQRLFWYKNVGSADGFAQWFGDDTTPTLVCTDADMLTQCSMGTIAASVGDATRMQGMTVDDYGFQSDFFLHMRLSSDGSAEHSGVCTGTFDVDGNAWHDSYAQHWGNALLVWLRE